MIAPPASTAPIERREHALEDERRLDEPVRRADQPHDAEFSASGERAQPDGRRDQEHGRDEHERRDPDRRVARGVHDREDRLEVATAGPRRCRRRACP